MSMVRQVLSLMTLVLLSQLACLSTAAPTSNESKLRNRTTLTSLSQTDELGEVGNPSELAYHAWLEMKDGFNSDPDLDTANQKRRIMPKSVFIAPNKTSCSDGYYPDYMNRCIKTIDIDAEAYLKFLEQRLQKLFEQETIDQASTPSSSPPSSPLPTGPLQLNIPLVLDSVPDDSAPANNYDEDDSIPSVIPLQIESEDLDHSTQNPIKHDISIVIQEETQESDKKEENSDASKIFIGLENTDVPIPSGTSTTTKPEESSVIEFIDETNSTFSENVNYKIPESEDNINNNTQVDYDGIEMIDENNKKNIDNKEITVPLSSPNYFESSPSPTIELPYEDYDLLSNSSLEIENVKPENSTNAESTEKVIIIEEQENVDTTATPIFTDSSEAINITSDLDIIFSVSTQSTTEDSLSTDDYPDEKLPAVSINREEAEDDSTESDEILAHSEAGLIVTIPPSRVQLFPTPTEVDKDTTGSTISSEVSINGDFIRETTLLGINYGKTTNVPENPPKVKDETLLNPTDDDEKVENSKQVKVTLLPLYSVSTTHSEFEDDNQKHDEKPKIIIQVTKMPENDKQTSLPSIIHIDGVSTTKIKYSNPVTNDEESLIGEFVDKKTPSSTKGPQIVYPSSISEVTLKNESPEIMEASSTNAAEETVIPQQEFDQVLSYNREVIGLQYPEVAKVIEMEYLTTTPASNQKMIYDHNFVPIKNKYPDRHHYTLDENNPEIKITNDQRFDPNRPIYADNNFPEHSVHNNAKDFVRFPTSERYENRPQFVRFPTEEANSIHTSDDFKERQHHRQHSQSNHRVPVKNSATGTFKRPPWSPWRTNRQQKRPRSNRGRKNRSPVRLHEFWTIMPLIGDLGSAHDPKYTIASSSDTISSRSHVSDKVHYFEDEPEDQNTRNVKNISPIGG